MADEDRARIECVSSMAGFLMAVIGGGGAKITENKNSGGCGKIVSLVTFRDQAANFMHRKTFASANFIQRIPHIRLKPHARSTTMNGNIAIKQATS